MLMLRLQTLCWLALLRRACCFEYSNGLITLPEYTLDTNEDTKISLKDIVCHNLTVGDVDITSASKSDNVLISAEIRTVGLVCRMDLTLKWNDIQADAQAYFESNNTDISSQMQLKGDSLLVEQCSATIRLKEMEITGLTGVMAVFVDSMRDSWMERMESALGVAFCDEFREAIPNILGGNVTDLSTLLIRLAEANAQPWKPSPQKRADSTTMVRLDENESSIEIVVQLAWMLSSYFLNSTNKDGSLMANSVARQLFRNNSNVYQMDKLQYSFDLKSSVLGDWGLDSVKITGGSVVGLDSIVQFNEIMPTSPTSLQTSIVFQCVQINLDGILYLNETAIVNGTVIDSTLTADDFEVELSLSGVSATIDLNLELLASYLEDINIGTILLSPDITSCLMGAIQNASVANIRFEKLEHLAPKVMNLEPVLEKLLTGSVNFLMIKYADLLPGVIGHLVNSAIIQAQSPFEGAESATCDFSTEIGTTAAYLDFRDLLLSPEKATVAGASGKTPYGSRAYKVKEFIDNQLLKAKPGTDRPYLNEKAPATTQQSGTPGTFRFSRGKPMFTYEDFLVLGNSTVPVRLDVQSLTLENLNHWLSPMVLLQPVQDKASGLNNLIQSGAVEDPSLKMSTVIKLTIDGDVSNEFVVNIEIKSLSVLVDLLVYIREDPFLLYRLGDLKKGQCLASLLETNAIRDNVRSETGVPPYDLSAFDMQLKGVKLDLQCHKCRDGTAETIVDVVSGVITSVFAEGLYLHMGYNQLAEKEEQRNIVSELLNNVERRSFLFRDFVDNFIAESPTKCENSAEYDPGAETEGIGLLGNIGFGPGEARSRLELAGSKGKGGYLISLFVLFGMLIGSWLLARAYVRYLAHQRQREWLTSLAPSQVIAIYEKQEKLRNHDFMINRLCTTIFSCEAISFPRKTFVVIALVGTIALFLMGISSTAASITLDLYTNNSLAYSFSVDYTLMTIVELTWESGGYFMAIATAFVVGLWPMARQFMTLFLLFIPSTYVDIKQRGQILFLLDQLGKVTMLVVFLSMLNAAAFFTSVESPPSSLLPFKLQLMYIPLWGTFATFLGQLISTIFLVSFWNFIVCRWQPRTQR